jgi:hypothetical protein
MQSDARKPGEREVMGLLRKIKFLGEFEPRQSPWNVIKMVVDGYRRWGIELKATPDTLKLLDGSVDKKEHSQEEKARENIRRKEQNARRKLSSELEEKWTADQTIRKAVEEATQPLEVEAEPRSVEVKSKPAESESGSVEVSSRKAFMKRVRARAMELYKNATKEIPNYFEEMQSGPNQAQEDSAKRHAIGFKAFLLELEEARKEDRFWEFPREIVLVDSRLEPMLIDKTKRANSPAHFLAVARLLVLMKLSSMAKLDPGPPNALMALIEVTPLELLPKSIDGTSLRLNQMGLSPLEEEVGFAMFGKVRRRDESTTGKEEIPVKGRAESEPKEDVEEKLEEPSLDDPAACVEYAKFLARQGAGKACESEVGTEGTEGEVMEIEDESQLSEAEMTTVKNCTAHGEESSMRPDEEEMVTASQELETQRAVAALEEAEGTERDLTERVKEMDIVNEGPGDGIELDYEE